FSVHSKDATGRTPLIHAAVNCNFQAVKGLIKRGADPSLMDKGGWIALHFAAQGGNTDFIDLIHAHLPDIESKTAEGHTPLMVAAFTGKLHAVKWFLEKGENVTCVDNRRWHMLHFAAQGGNTDVIDLIHTFWPDIESNTAEGYIPLMVAALTGKLHAVKWFLEKGPNVTCVDNRRWNMLHFAAEGGDTDVIDLIRTHLPDIESKETNGNTPLMVAALKGKLHAVKRLLEKGANVTCVNDRRWNMLHCAVRSSNPDVIDLILTHVPDIESKAANGATSLVIAVRCGKLQGVKHLERGANPLSKDNDGQDSLYLASSRGSDVLDLLLSHVDKRTTGVSKKDPERLSKKIEEVREPLGGRLNIEGEKLTAFDKENEQFNLKAYKILLHWKQKEDSAATFEVMYNALCHQIVN
ncbi:ankyrin repeat and EF-hand domain-containing protein 1-like, partial [Stylophora pistillata]|uniref:ankyrin repeat and EF-hand domain-containing protein 1-like n=1 Tax=Stylophora pistillata TaxID=50429 RepID=UPI000C03E923